jgi:hypothetical protein
VGVYYLTKIRSVLIKYKFIFKDNITHSSYLYQKVFRSIYGYNQNVTKKNNKIYNYFREGVISNHPYIKYGKNSLILPIGCESELLDYFETGKNPTHNWRIRGDWKVEFTKDFIDVDIESVSKALEDLINSYKIINSENKEVKLNDELDIILTKENLNVNYINTLLNIMKRIINTNWFNEVYQSNSNILKFYETYNKLKVKFNL